MKILIINPGGTSTKIAIYEDEEEIFKYSINHSGEDLKKFISVIDEYEYRVNLIKKVLLENGYDLESINCVSGRGGLMKAIPGGTYEVNDSMINDMKNSINGDHASNLGCVIAKSLAKEIGVRAFVVDPVSVDEMLDICRLTGLSDITKLSWFHTLNHKAVARKTAQKIGKKYEECNFIVAHLGSGISIAPHCKGKMIDGSGGRSDGPFSPERCGGLPSYQLVELCYSGEYTKDELVKRISGYCGMYDYLGTKDMIEIERRYDAGDEKAILVLDAFMYQVAKEISKYAASLCGDVDRIILTGGIAYSNRIVREVTKRVEFIAPVEVVAGEMEMEALALGALRVLRGEEKPKIY
jgi:butyrate kinase